MQTKRKAGVAGRRERRAFTAEFKAEAVRLVAERRALGMSAAQVARELELRPDQLRTWARQQALDMGAGSRGVGESSEQELRRLRRLRRENAVLRQEQAFAKKWRCTSRKSRVERCRDHSPSGRVPSATHVPGARGLAAGYYAKCTRPPSVRTLADAVLMAHVRVAHRASGNTYGAPRVQHELQADGIPVSTKRVARLMRQDGLVAYTLNTRPRKTLGWRTPAEALERLLQRPSTTGVATTD